MLIDVAGLGISGYQAADWLRSTCRIDVGLNDHRRIEATMSQSDDEQTAARLLTSLRQLIDEAPRMPAPVRVNGTVIDYLQSGVAAGMVLPDRADPSMTTVRVVANDHPAA